MRRMAFGVVVLSALLATAWVGGRIFFAWSVAAAEGELAVVGLEAPVEILFDDRAVPQVFAQTETDCLFSLGWLHGTERFFQMELVRRVAAGRLAELFGEAAFDLDVEHRRLGFARRAEQAAVGLEPRVEAMLRSYVDGVEAGRRSLASLPPELVILRLEPEPWSVTDVLAVLGYQTWFAHELVDAELGWADLEKALGPDVAELLHRDLGWSAPTVSSAEAGLRLGMASNAWAVAPSRSASGSALHASDPHLEVDRAPGLWYLAGLHSVDGLEAVGVTAPGLPFVTMGHNGRVAWSGTVAGIDLVDRYRFDRDPDDPTRLLGPDGPFPVTRRVESVVVKGEPEGRRLEIGETPFGVIVEDLGPAGAVVLRWAGFDFELGAMVQHAMEIGRVGAFEPFRRAVTGLGALDFNWVYSDRAGHIGYQLGAPVPLRSIDRTLLPLDGADGASFWRGYAELEATPAVLDPAEGWVASCNNRVVPETWPDPVPGFWDPYRIERIRDELERGRDGFTGADMGRLQMDSVSQLALRWKALAADGATAIGRSDLAATLRAWDGAMRPELEVGALFSGWWVELARAAFEDELGQEWLAGSRLLERLLTFELASVIDDRRTPLVEDAVALSARAVTAAAARWEGRTLGEVSTLTVRHPLSRVALLDRWLGLTRGPFPVPGDHASLHASFRRYEPESGSWRVAVGPSMRFVLDWADVDGFSIVLACGQSGHPLSPHFDDFLPLWRAGERWNMPFTRAAIESRATRRVRLVPAE